MLSYNGSVVINYDGSDLIFWDVEGDAWLNDIKPRFSAKRLRNHLDILFKRYGNQDREWWWVESLEVYDFDNLNHTLFPHLKILKEFIKKYNLEDKFYIYTHNWADRFKEFKVKRLCNFLSFGDHEVNTIYPVITKKFPRHFLYLNRKHRKHREILFNMIQSGNILDKCFWSYRSKDIDKGVIGARKIEGTITTPDDLFINTTFCHIVTETQFFNNHPYYGETIFITEKVDKAIRFAQPFIVVSSPNYLKTMRDLGFKTFNQWWDESYDTVHEWDKRINMVYDQVKEISTWSQSYLSKVYREMIPTLIHNQKVRTYLAMFKKDNYLCSEKVFKYNKFCDYDDLKLWLSYLDKI